MTDKVNVLKSARSKIARGWTRGWFSTKENNRKCEPSDPDACKWCAIGAIMSAAVDEESPHALECLMDLRASLPEGTHSVGLWNDSQGSAYPVLQLFDRTIERLENEPR